MKHARLDYDRMQDPSGKIPDDEPVFLLRAQDPVAAELVMMWAARTMSLGGDKAMIDMATQHAVKMRDWPTKKAVADLPQEGAMVGAEWGDFGTLLDGGCE